MVSSSSSLFTADSYSRNNTGVANDTTNKPSRCDMTASHHQQHQDPETEAAEANPAVTDVIIQDSSYHFSLCGQSECLLFLKLETDGASPARVQYCARQ